MILSRVELTWTVQFLSVVIFSGGLCTPGALRANTGVAVQRSPSV